MAMESLVGLGIWICGLVQCKLHEANAACYEGQKTSSDVVTSVMFGRFKKH